MKSIVFILSLYITFFGGICALIGWALLLGPWFYMMHQLVQHIKGGRDEIGT